MSLPFLKSPQGQEPVVVEGGFRAAPERVFRAWTDPEEIKKWFGPGGGGLQSASIDLRVGGAWRFDFPAAEGRRDSLHGEYLEIDPGRRLVFSWTHLRAFDDGREEVTPASQVTVTFEPSDQGAFVRLLHERIAREAGRLGVGEGWNGAFASLERLFATEVAS
ncbi:MAG: SRPBCC domain-containing protein [Rhodospirillales bacterium]